MFLDNSLLINQKKFETIEKDITCPICQGILNDPYFCNKCQNNFCGNCIDKYKANNNKCPFRCKNPEYINNKFLKRILNELLKFKCQKGCEEIISYKDVNNHYENCPKEDFKQKYLECATTVEILKLQIEDFNDIKNQLDEEKERNDELENQLEELREDKNELENELERLKFRKEESEELQELEELRSELDDKNELIENLLNQINDLKKYTEDLKYELDKQNYLFLKKQLNEMKKSEANKKKIEKKNKQIEKQNDKNE